MEDSSTNELCALVMVDRRPENGRDGEACGWLPVWSCAPAPLALH